MRGGAPVSTDDGHLGVARVARLLRAFDDAHPELTLTELAGRTGLPLTTTSRLADALVGERLLGRRGRRFSLGVGLWELGEAQWLSLRLREAALPHLLTLYEATGENVHLAVLDGVEALYVGRIVGTRSVPTMTRMGGRLPLHTTGVGKALLAWQDDAFLERYLAEPLTRFTPYTRTAEADVRRDIAEIRVRGFATASQETTIGGFSIAAPVLVGDAAAAAVGLVTHLARGDAARLAPTVRAAASRIAAELE